MKARTFIESLASDHEVNIYDYSGKILSSTKAGRMLEKTNMYTWYLDSEISKLDSGLKKTEIYVRDRYDDFLTLPMWLRVHRTNNCKLLIYRERCKPITLSDIDDINTSPYRVINVDIDITGHAIHLWLA